MRAGSSISHFLILSSLLCDVNAAETVQFNQEIRPLLASKCFACHGPDEEHREADLRLDERQDAIDLGAITPGEPEESEMIRRIFSNDADEVMPPPNANQALTDEQKQILHRWIKEGAKYDKHWSFVRPTRPAEPSVGKKTWPKNPIDNFVLARLEKEGISPSAEADRFSLVRRVYLDLIGLPPSPKEADEFIHSPDTQAYEKLVDRLLKSPRYGERWARDWLDLARYADTNGYEKDRARSIWPFRDWVIRALNDDMPFDQFSIEQLAGDMLPNPTESQFVATGFHRNTMLNEEGGIDPLEYRFYAMVDRVATTGTVWLGLTTGCAQCHTHKYDPITHTDYYRFLALLNNADEPDRLLKTPEVQERRQALLQEIERLEADLPERFPAGENIESKFEEWLTQIRSSVLDWSIIRPTKMQSNLPKLELLEDGSIFSSGDITKRDVFHLSFSVAAADRPITAIRLEAMADERLPEGGPGRAYYEGRKGDFFLSELTMRIDDSSVRFVSPSRSYGKIAIGSGNAEAKNVIDGDGSTGWSTAEREGESHQLVLNLEKPIQKNGELQIELIFERHFAASLGRFRFSTASTDKVATAKELPVAIESILAKPKSEWTSERQTRIKRYFYRVSPDLAEARKPIDRLRKQLSSLPYTMIMQERPDDNPRPTHRHHRGEFLSPRELVNPGIPAIFAETSTQRPIDRLTLARWLVSAENPLVARVTVNRAWQSFFGKGLVRSSGDFGTQADPPTHPELLDWLACELIECGWSMKKIHRLIVTSATYRQSAIVSPEHRERDPQNRLIARGPRFRLNAETIRDVMLHASGLLSPKMYGPSVYPPQPRSVTAVAYGGSKWKESQGEDRYRRSLYTFSKRTTPFAAYTVFDGPTGENCIARRDQSNTPLQALTLLNDEMFLEMARALAKQVANLGTEEQIATTMFRRLLTRPPEKNEIDAILTFYRSQLKRLDTGELKSTDISVESSNSSNELAAWVMTARAIMNLDEVITKP